MFGLITFWNIGAVVSFYLCYRLLWWCWVSFLRPINLQLYRRGQTWAVVTGSTDGIGLAFAQTLAAHGFNILLVGRNSEKLETVRKSLMGTSKVQVDYVVSDAMDVSANNVRKVVEKCQSRDISILINNVGMHQGGIKILDDLDPTAMQNAITVNCTYPTLLTRELLPLMRRHQGRKLIVNLASVAALLMNPFAAVYAGTKAYNRQFSRALSAELAADGFDVLCVNPGFVESNMTKMRPGPFCCTARECAETSLRKIGEIEVIPHWKHSLMYAIMMVHNLIPNKYLPSVVFSIIYTVRKKTGRLNKD